MFVLWRMFVLFSALVVRHGLDEWLSADGPACAALASASRSASARLRMQEKRVSGHLAAALDRAAAGVCHPRLLSHRTRVVGDRGVSLYP